MKVACYLLVVLLVALLLAGESNAWRWFRNTFRKKYPITATGRIQCYIDGSYKPMPQILVKLMDKELIGNKFIASTWADENGRFTVSGEGRDLIGKPDPRIRVDYEFLGVPSYGGKIKVQDRLRWIRRYRSTVRSYASNINFGDINISDEHCRAYMRFYAAVKNYISRTGTSLPYSTLHIGTNAVFASWFNAVYATLDRIRIQRGEDLTTETAQHELAHTVRHSYDGNNGHFLVDAVRFNYARHHDCGKQTNDGFAFNEGWAEFWAGECYSKLYVRTYLRLKLQIGLKYYIMMYNMH